MALPATLLIGLLVDRTPDAVNVWIGGSRSVTSVHSGNATVH